MEIKPLYDVVGMFGYFFDSEAELLAFQKQNKLDYNNKRYFFKIDGDYFEYSFLNSTNKISTTQIKNYLSPILPYWIKDNQNFDRIIEHNYNSLLPHTAEIIPTLNCCFRCEQCSNKEPKKQLDLWERKLYNRSEYYHMNAETVKIIIDKLSATKVKNIVFTGGGEPLLNSDVTLFGMEYAKRQKMNVGLYTNGMFISSIFLEKIKIINPLFIRISIYGLDEVSFANYTSSNKENYSKILSNVKNLLKLKIEKQIDTAISISFLVHPVLFPDDKKICDFFEIEFNKNELKHFSTIRFTPAVDYYNNEQHEKNFFDKIFNQVDNLTKKYKDITNIVSYSHRYKDLYSKKIYDQCRANGLYAEISPNGNMYLCCEKLFNDAYYIGNILQNSIEEIYSSNLRINVIDTVNKTNCMDCPTLCKPHEINKQINLIEHIDKQQILEWRKELLVSASDKPYFSGNLNAFES